MELKFNHGWTRPVAAVCDRRVFDHKMDADKNKTLTRIALMFANFSLNHKGADWKAQRVFNYEWANFRLATRSRQRQPALAPAIC
jgi:hypothetical protein